MSIPLLATRDDCPLTDNFVQTSLTVFQLSILTLILGLTAEVALSGIISTICFILKKGINQSWRLATIITFFNVWCIAYMCCFFASSFLVKETCDSGTFVTNLASHFFYNAFDAFLLYKAFATSSGNGAVFYACVLLIAHRMAWSGADLFHVVASWDADNRTCQSVANAVTGIGYNAADIAIDLFSTIVSIGSNWKLMGTSYGKMVEVIAYDNILRSVVVLSITSYGIYVSATSTDLYTILISFCVQNYVYTRCVNAEMEERHRGHTQATNGNQYKSAVKQAEVGSKSGRSFVTDGRSIGVQSGVV
ncbi:hypothetical protein CcCBS67573_g09419 [Chytriomyces confervae]|uniref:Uncharacterized protein n=1 Tax=Chytriomyces confervae TaxID=246404 RepID=A0A507DXG0_9FUNG|nr:hypothetical protein CcCBS67573_g09419 [Chytriomyces confervae]